MLVGATDGALAGSASVIVGVHCVVGVGRSVTSGDGGGGFGGPVLVIVVAVVDVPLKCWCWYC